MVVTSILGRRLLRILDKILQRSLIKIDEILNRFLITYYILLFFLIRDTDKMYPYLLI